MDKATVDGCVQRHFMQFAIRYHARTPLTSSDRALLRGHLAVLCALAKTKTEVVARRFYQLCVMDLCVHELSLECQLGNGVVAGAQEVRRGLVGGSRSHLVGNTTQHTVLTMMMLYPPL